MHYLLPELIIYLLLCLMLTVCWCDTPNERDDWHFYLSSHPSFTYDLQAEIRWFLLFLSISSFIQTHPISNFGIMTSTTNIKAPPRTSRYIFIYKCFVKFERSKYLNFTRLRQPAEWILLKSLACELLSHTIKSLKVLFFFVH